MRRLIPAVLVLAAAVAGCSTYEKPIMAYIPPNHGVMEVRCPSFPDRGSCDYAPPYYLPSE